MSLQSIANLSTVITNKFEVKYAEILNKAGKLGAEFTQEITSDTLQAHIPFINQWTGVERQDPYASVNYETITGQYVTIDAAKYAKGIQAGKFDWHNEVTQSLIMGQVDGLAADAALVRTKRIASILSLGETSAFPALYGGGNFFGTSHSLNGTTFSNLLAGNALTTTGLQAAVDVLQAIPLGPNGENLPTEVCDWTLVIHPHNRVAANLLMNNQYFYDTSGSVPISDNPWKGFANVVESSFLQDRTDWYLMIKFPGMTPFATVRHATSSATLIPRIAETDPAVINNNLYTWNLQLIEETFGVHWYLVVKCTVAGS